MCADDSTVPLSVLVVDDCPDTTASLAFLINAWGHQVAVANNGPEALRLAAQTRPEVVLLDIAMPGMNGWEVVRELRKMPELTGVRVVAVSGCARKEDAARSVAEGCQLHLAKPVEPIVLERLLSYCKSRRQKAEAV
jgi:CheY-like chemotaxis protein